MMLVTYRSDAKSLRSDRSFFEKRPYRIFRARRYNDQDTHIPKCFPVFSKDEEGNLREINLTIVKRILGGRHRMLFATTNWRPLSNDAAIARFLRSRGVDPDTMEVDRHDEQ
jgi:hypothetical protein